MSEVFRTYPAALGLANEAWLYDNSGDEPRMVLEARDGAVVWRADDEPAWVARVREAMTSDARGQK
jgi:predicted ABC-type ATPase